MTATLVASTPIDVHRTSGGLEVLLIGRDGARTAGDRAGLENLTMKLIAYLWGEDARVVLWELEHDEDDDPRPPESEYETLGPSGWDRPSRGT